MQYFEVRKEKEKAGETSPVWTYVAPEAGNAARLHIDQVFGPTLAKYPDFWEVMSIEPVGKPSRVDRRQLFEAKLRTNRRGGKINNWEVDRFIVRPIIFDDI